MHALFQDLRYGIRKLAKYRLSNLVIVVTIALLVGAISTIYAALANLQRGHMPFPKPERLVKLRRVGEGRILDVLPAALFHDLRRHLKSFAELGAIANGGEVTLTQRGEPQSLHVDKVTASVLRLAGIPPMLGRLFAEEDERAGQNQVVILSNKVWREVFSADDAIAGQTVWLNQEPYTVAGVMPPALDSTVLSVHPQIWMPEEFLVASNLPGGYVKVVGRLQHRLTRKQAQAEVEAVSRALEQGYSPSEWERQVYGGGFSHAEVVAPGAPPAGGRPGGYIAVGVFVVSIALCVVLIACFNVTNLLLVRMSVRAREIAICFSLGARRWRIVRQLLTESVLLGLVGGALGLIVALWICGLLRLRHLDVRIDPRLYLVAFGSSVFLGAAVGLLPALRATGAGLHEALKEGGQTSGGPKRHRLRNLLTGAQVAMAMVLCVTAGLLTCSFIRMKTIYPGFDRDRLLTLDIDPRRETYSKLADRHNYAGRVLQTLEELPGVTGSALVSPPSLFGWTIRDRTTIEATGNHAEQYLECHLLYVSAKFTALTGLPVLRGRGLSQERGFAEPEALVNQRFVDAYLGGTDPLTVRIKVSSSRGEWLQIIGIVGQRSRLSPDDPARPEIYTSYLHANLTAAYQFLVVTATDARAFKEPVRQVIQRLDPLQPVSPARTGAEAIDVEMVGERYAMTLFSVLAGCGLFIALLGVYGVVAYSVAERTHEVGVRIALGATKAAVVRLVMREGTRLTACGAVPGVVLAYGITRGLPRAFMGTGPTDLLAYLAVILLVTVTAFLAALLPALRAARANPVVALRYE